MSWKLLRLGIRCSVDEEGHVMSIHEVAEVFTDNVDSRFVFHVPQDPINGDTEEGWCQDTALPHT